MRYEIAFKLLSSLIFIPLISIIINYFISKSGRGVITNSQLLSFSTSLPGIVTIFLLIIISSIFINLEFGGLIIISKDTYFENNPSAFKAFLKACKNITKSFGAGSFQISIYILLIVPFLGIGATSNLLSEINIPSFIEDYLLSNYKGIILLLSLLFIAHIFLVRWIFAFHIAIIEKKNFKASLKRSKELVKGQFFKILKAILIFNILNLVIVSILLGVLIGLPLIVVYKLGSNSFISLTLLSFLSITESTIMFISQIFTAPFNMALVTRLYYSRMENIDKIKNSNKDTHIEEEVNHKTYFKRLYKFNKNKMFLGGFILILILSIFGSLLLYYADIDKNNVTITAHRGNSIEAPENTKSAISYALKTGADYAEIDVQETKDGKIVVIHDSNLKRLTGYNVNLWDLDYNELEKYEVGSWFSEEFKGEKIPTLEEIIKEVKGKMKINIEIKTHGHEKMLVENVVSIIEKEDFIDQCVVTSLDYDCLKKVKAINPSIKTGYIMYMVLGDIAKLNVDFYSLEATNVNKKLVNKAHLIGREVHVWTVNDEEKMKEFIDMGVDSIITDYPETLKNILENRKKNNIIENILDYYQ